jgi:hypothetical protein
MAKKSSVKLSDLMQGQQNLGGYSELTSYREGGAKSTQVDRVSKEEFMRILKSMGQEAATAGSATGPVLNSTPNTKIFEEFIKQTQKREELLKDATEEQVQIFKELEAVILKLKTGTHDDTKALKKSIDDLSKRLGGTPANQAKTNIQKAIPAAYQSPAFVKPLEAKEGPMFTGSGLAKDTQDVEASSDNEHPGILSGLTSGLGNILKDVVGYKLAKKFLDTSKTPAAELAKKKGVDKNNRVLVDDKGDIRERKPGAKYQKNGKWFEIDKEGKARPTKTPSGINKMKLDATGGAKKLAGRVGILAPLYAISDAVLQYEETGNLTKSLVTGSSGLVGGVVGDVVTGNPFGGVAGAMAGQYAGEKINDNIEGDPIKDTAKRVLKSVQDFAHAANQVIPKATESVSNSIKSLTTANEEKKKPSVEVGQPTIINNYNSSTAAPPNINIPMASLRPTESAFNRHQFRNYQV